MAEYNGSIELISGITQKGGGSFPLACSKDIQVDDDGKRLDEKLSEIDQKLNKNPDTGTSGTIPVFDLASLGLPTVPKDGTSVSLTTDTTQMMAALDAGAAKFAFNLGTEGRIEVVMTPFKNVNNELYMACYTMLNGSSTGTICIMIFDGYLQVGFIVAAATSGGASASIPVYDFTELGIPTIVVGGDPLELAFDTTALMNDLSRGEIIIKGKFDIGDGYPMELTKTCRATSVEGEAYLITTIDDMGGNLLVTTIMVMPGVIVINVYPYTNTVVGMIDAYMQEALGGDY